MTTGPSKGDIYIRDGRDGSLLRTLEGHTDRVTGVTEITGGKLLSWSFDKTLRLWNLKNGECELIFAGHENWVEHALPHPDGRIASWAFDDNEVRLWNVRNGACEHTVSGPSWDVRAQFLRGSRLLLWSGDGRSLDLWIRDLSSGTLVILEGHTKYGSGRTRTSGRSNRLVVHGRHDSDLGW
jgi:WD40 repeat protein